jgi:hypothetical protein
VHFDELTVRRDWIAGRVRAHSSSVITVADLAGVGVDRRDVSTTLSDGSWSPNPLVFVQAVIRILFPMLDNGHTTHLTSAV